MPYATQTDIIERYGEEELVIASDRDGDGEIDPEAVSKAVNDASDEIDIYLAARYDLPLSTVPGVLKRLCADIALYRLSSDRGTATDEKRLRYEDAVKLLKLMAEGTVALGLPKEDESDDLQSGIEVSAPDRQFPHDIWEKF